MTVRLPRWLAELKAGFAVSWLTLLLIAAINTGVAALLWIEDPRPFWHPLISAQCFGFAIAYCVNVASPWEKRLPILRLVVAVAIGALLGMLLTIVVKGYTIAYLREHFHTFALTVVTGFTNGLFVSLFFLHKFRETRTEAALLKERAERHLLSRQAVEAELKLMQAQVEPHFLFNTLASVHYLNETDPPAAGRLLGHLLEYLRAALPQLRCDSTTLGKEIELVEAYLNVMQIRLGSRLSFSIDVPEPLRALPFAPVLLISLAENAIQHGIEPQAEGGAVRIEAARVGKSIRVAVTDTGAGLVDGRETPAPGRGVGLSNLRERLAALYGRAGHFTLENVVPHGARATIVIPVQAA